MLKIELEDAQETLGTIVSKGECSILAIRGIPGTGKTTLAHNLLASDIKRDFIEVASLIWLQGFSEKQFGIDPRIVQTDSPV